MRNADGVGIPTIGAVLIAGTTWMGVIAAARVEAPWLVDMVNAIGAEQFAQVVGLVPMMFIVVVAMCEVALKSRGRANEA